MGGTKASAKENDSKLTEVKMSTNLATGYNNPDKIK